MSRRRGELAGLVRLRTVRERDSRAGLATALTEERRAEDAVRHAEELLATRPVPANADLVEFHRHQQTLDSIRTALGRAQAERETARILAAAARDRWLADRARLKAVESLVERRAAAVRTERERRERIRLDEVAEQMWRRARMGGVA